MATEHRPSKSRGDLRRKRGRTSGLAAFKRKVTRALESIEDRLDYLESELSIADGKPIPAAKAWRSADA